MRILNKLLVLFGLLLFLPVFANEVDSPESKLNENINLGGCSNLRNLLPLIGRWQSTAEQSVTIEQWRQVSDDTLEGNASKIIPGNDEAKPFETLRLLAMNNKVFYLAKVEENPLPIAFELTGCSTHYFIFENPQHDFPQKIRYDFLAEDKLRVTVSDLEGKGFHLNYKKKSVNE